MKLLKVAVAGAVALVLVVALLNAYVLTSAGDATADVSDVPEMEVAIVPGALVKPDGTMSLMLADRVEQAARLWHAGKVEKILVSGDHGSWDYDEPDTMRKALVRDGVERRDVFEDHGFQGKKSDVREVLSRLKAVADVTLDRPVTDGPKIPIATSDGRESWGMVPPAGVPPAGSPGR